jgi:hypothetical protein
LPGQGFDLFIEKGQFVLRRCQRRADTALVLKWV